MVVVAVDVTFVQVVVLYLFDDKVIGAYPPLRKRGMRLTNILEDYIYISYSVRVPSSAEQNIDLQPASPPAVAASGGAAAVMCLCHICTRDPVACSRAEPRAPSRVFLYPMVNARNNFPHQTRMRAHRDFQLFWKVSQ